MKRKFMLIFLMALVLRLAFVFSAYHGDLNNNISWGRTVVDQGLNNFYERQIWEYSAPNQPPLYVLLFAACVWVFEAVKSVVWGLNRAVPAFPSGLVWFWEEKGMVLLLKLPSILADLGIGYLIYDYFSEKRKSKLGLLLSGVWLFNPVSWYNSSVWGQTDGVINFLGLFSILLLLKRRFVLSSGLWTLGLLFKGSLVLFTPILLVVALLQKYGLKHWLRSIVLASVVVVFISFWFHPGFDLPIWLFTLYQKRIFPGEIGYLTANAFNSWWLVDAGRTLDFTVYLGLPARIWGLVVTLAGLLGLGLWLYRSKPAEGRVFLSLVILSLMSFLFLTRIHERYMYPFFPLGTLLLGLVPSFWFPYLVLSFTHLLNLYHLFWYPPLPALESLYGFPRFPIILSIVNLLVFIFILRYLRSAKI